VKIGLVAGAAAIGLTLGLAWSAAPARAQQEGVTAAPQAPEPRPFRSAVEAGDLLFLSGEIGMVPKGMDPQGDGYEAAVRDAMDSIGRVLAEHKLDFGDVVKCTAMLGDMSKWTRFNRVYVGYFPKDKLPARSAFGGMKLAFDAPLEVECIAHLRSRAGAR